MYTNSKTPQRGKQSQSFRSSQRKTMNSSPLRKDSTEQPPNLSMADHKWIHPSAYFEDEDTPPHTPSMEVREAEDHVNEALHELTSINTQIQDRLSELETNFTKSAQDHKQVLMQSFKRRLHEAASVIPQDDDDEADADTAYWIKKFKESEQSVAFLKLEMERIHRLNETLSGELKRKTDSLQESEEENEQLETQLNRLKRENESLEARIAKEKQRIQEERAKMLQTEQSPSVSRLPKTDHIPQKKLGEDDKGKDIEDGEVLLGIEDDMKGARSNREMRASHNLGRTATSSKDTAPTKPSRSRALRPQKQPLPSSKATLAQPSTLFDEVRAMLDTSSPGTSLGIPPPVTAPITISQQPIPNTSLQEIRDHLAALRQTLAETKQKRLRIRSETVAQEEERNELQQLFIQCIEEVKGELDAQEALQAEGLEYGPDETASTSTQGSSITHVKASKTKSQSIKDQTVVSRVSGRTQKSSKFQFATYPSYSNATFTTSSTQPSFGSFSSTTPSISGTSSSSSSSASSVSPNAQAALILAADSPYSFDPTIQTLPKEVKLLVYLAHRTFPSSLPSATPHTSLSQRIQDSPSVSNVENAITASDTETKKGDDWKRSPLTTIPEPT